MQIKKWLGIDEIERSISEPIAEPREKMRRKKIGGRLVQHWKLQKILNDPYLYLWAEMLLSQRRESRQKSL